MALVLHVQCVVIFYRQTNTKFVLFCQISQVHLHFKFPQQQQQQQHQEKSRRAIWLLMVWLYAVFHKSFGNDWFRCLTCYKIFIRYNARNIFDYIHIAYNASVLFTLEVNQGAVRNRASNWSHHFPIILKIEHFIFWSEWRVYVCVS